MKNKIIEGALIDAVLAAIYIGFVAWFMFYVGNSRVFTNVSPMLGIMLMLSVFVFSATLVGALVLGRPIMWYLGGQKREAVSLFVYTLVVFFIITVILFAVALFAY
jgi:hypothetical protein